MKKKEIGLLYNYINGIWSRIENYLYVVELGNGDVCVSLFKSKEGNQCVGFSKLKETMPISSTPKDIDCEDLDFVISVSNLDAAQVLKKQVDEMVKRLESET